MRSGSAAVEGRQYARRTEDGGVTTVGLGGGAAAAGRVRGQREGAARKRGEAGEVDLAIRATPAQARRVAARTRSSTDWRRAKTYRPGSAAVMSSCPSVARRPSRTSRMLLPLALFGRAAPDGSPDRHAPTSDLAPHPPPRHPLASAANHRAVTTSRRPRRDWPVALLRGGSNARGAPSLSAPFDSRSRGTVREPTHSSPSGRRIWPQSTETADFQSFRWLHLSAWI
ncbi:uncharacterized protein V1518DRAFT_239591 [Limtongia smithiae]|uniref:uncharacterized protein n=1 Tax=Limtongia smithiae TaxID=1125753 RepID=UPI0034CFE94E